MPWRKTGSGVWMKIAASVPTTTIMNAAVDNSALMPAPFMIEPTSTAGDRENEADYCQDIHG